MKTITALCMVLALLDAGLASAQSKTAAALTGTVTDQKDATVPGAKIKLTNAETGRTLEAVSDERGQYSLPLTPPGIYNVTVEKEGFGAQSRKGFVLTVGEAASLDFKLAVGASTQMVEVQAEPPVIETERVQQSTTINEQEVRNLPINRRDYLSFALLAPGVADSSALADANSFRVKQTPTSGLSFYGSNGRGNSISVDGGESNDAGGGVRPTVSQEAVQEFQINRTNYSAEHGQARGGVIDIVTKAGVNTPARVSVRLFPPSESGCHEPIRDRIAARQQLAQSEPRLTTATVRRYVWRPHKKRQDFLLPLL